MPIPASKTPPPPTEVLSGGLMGSQEFHPHAAMRALHTPTTWHAETTWSTGARHAGLSHPGGSARGRTRSQSDLPGLAVRRSPYSVSTEAK